MPQQLTVVGDHPDVQAVHEQGHSLALVGVPHADVVQARPVTQRHLATLVDPIGSRGDSYDNAMAESVIGLCKTALIRQRGPWKSFDDVEYSTLEWVDWFNHRRLLGPIGYVPPEEARYDEQAAVA